MINIQLEASALKATQLEIDRGSLRVVVNSLASHKITPASLFIDSKIVPVARDAQIHINLSLTLDRKVN